MKIKKILNNNVITTIDETTGLEKVVMGKGIAFKMKIGQRVDRSKVEKVFYIENQNDNIKFQQLVNEIPLEYIKASEKIISYAKKTLNQELDDHIYIALTDHIAFSIKRALSNVNIKNLLLWEIQRIYQKEYAVGLWALNFLEKELGVKMPEDEAGFIALHLINSSIGYSMEETMDMTTIVQDTLNIIKYYFSIDFDENDIFYDRLLTHLKYFARRITSKNGFDDDDEEILNLVKEKYKDQYDCALKIKEYIEKNYNHKISEAELTYLSLHLQRVVSRIKK